MASSISGNVGGAVASGASVRLLPKNVTAPGSAVLAVANGSGNYTFTNVAKGAYTLSASLSGYVYKSTADIVMVATEDLSAINLAPTLINAG